MLKIARHKVLGWIAAAMLLTGCQYDSVVNQIREDTERNDSVAIDFGNGVIDNPIRTRSSVSLLSQHTNTRGVWGWQTTKDDQVVCQFRDKEVIYSPDLVRWTYSPARYWDKGSSYRFYAYAPHANSVPDATVSIDEQTGFISIQDIILNGCNTMSSQTRPAPTGSFIDVDDIDWMIDRAGQKISKENIYTRVTFNMQHILAKFNVMVVASSAIISSGSILTLDSMSIGDFLSKGDFIQKLDHTPVSSVATDMAVKEWKLDSTRPRYSLQCIQNLNVTTDVCCVIESLLLPQVMTDDIMLRLHYTIKTLGGHIEHYVFTIKLNEAFKDTNEFMSANNYTLTRLIGEDNRVIPFDSGSPIWDEEVNKEWIIEN